jgi:beta-lactam-binding protein with PASTA domain
VTSFNATYPKGQVWAQYPAAGTSLAPGTVVGINVSNGSPTTTATVSVPSVVGKTQSDAQSALKKASLSNVVIQWAGTGKPNGQVVAQTPDASAVVPKNITVIIFVSNGQ